MSNWSRRIATSACSPRVWSAVAALMIGAMTAAAALALNPSGVYAAEFFRFVLQLNVVGVIATVGTTLVALILAALSGHLRRHPRQGLRWPWLLVIATPLIVTAASLVLSIVPTEFTSRLPAADLGSRLHEVAQGRPQAEPGEAARPVVTWLTVVGTLWFAWFVDCVFGATVRHLAHQREVQTALAAGEIGWIFGTVPSQTRPIGDLDTAYEFVCRNGDVQRKQHVSITAGSLRALYLQCAERLALGLNTLPALIKVSNEDASRMGPHYCRVPRIGFAIILPGNLGHSLQLIASGAFARTTRRLAGSSKRHVHFDPAKWALTGLAVLLLHELGHHKSRDTVLSRLLAVTRALFPLPWMIMSFPGAARTRIRIAKEQTCDTDVVARSGIEPWTVQLVLQSIWTTTAAAKERLAAWLRVLDDLSRRHAVASAEMRELKARLRALQSLQRTGTAHLRACSGIAATFVISCVSFFAAPVGVAGIALTLPKSLPFQEQPGAVASRSDAGEVFAPRTLSEWSRSVDPLYDWPRRESDRQRQQYARSEELQRDNAELFRIERANREWQQRQLQQIDRLSKLTSKPSTSIGGGPSPFGPNYPGGTGSRGHYDPTRFSNPAKPGNLPGGISGYRSPVSPGFNPASPYGGAGSGSYRPSTTPGRIGP